MSSVLEALDLEDAEALEVVKCVPRLYLAFPGVNAASSALPGHTQCGLATALLGWRGVLCPQRLSNTWPGYVNGEVWVLRVNHVSSCLLSLNYPSNKEHRKRSPRCRTTSWRCLKVLTGRRGLRGQFWHHSLRLPGCSASQWLGQALSLQNGRVHRGRSSIAKGLETKQISLLFWFSVFLCCQMRSLNKMLSRNSSSFKILSLYWYYINIINVVH